MSAAPGCRRRGVAGVQVAVTAVVLIGFASLAIDVGRMYTVRAELQRAADSAALAAASGMVGDGILEGDYAPLLDRGRTLAHDAAGRNNVFLAPSHLLNTDIQFGTIADPNNLSSPMLPPGADMPNAVQVMTRRSVGSIDGPVPLTFAAIFGKHEASIVSDATAIIDDRFAGVKPPVDGEGLLLPFTVSKTIADDMMVNGDDYFSFDDGTDTVEQVGDGIPEIRLFPWKEKDTNGVLQVGPDGAGNFGVLNIGVGNQGTSYVEDQIINGVTQQNLYDEIGSTEIKFFDDSGNPITHGITGNTGISTGMKDSVTQRIGDVIGYFVHDYIDDTGQNAVFTIVGIRFARVMEIDLTGSIKNTKNGKRIVLQPVAYEGSAIITDPGAPPTHYLINRVRLVR